jgi:hypothetical protein
MWRVRARTSSEMQRVSLFRHRMKSEESAPSQRARINVEHIELTQKALE